MYIYFAVYTSVLTKKCTGNLEPRQITGTPNQPAACSRLCFALGAASDPLFTVNMMKNEVKFSITLEFVSTISITKRKKAVL